MNDLYRMLYFRTVSAYVGPGGRFPRKKLEDVSYDHNSRTLRGTLDWR